MNVQRLADLIEGPELHRTLLGEYDGTYSIGVTTNPADSSRPAIRVRVEDAEDLRIPSEIVLDGEPVRVLVQTRFVPPRTLPLRVKI